MNGVVAAIAGVTTNELILDAVLGVAGAIFCYRASESDKARRGTTPWHFPSSVWAALLVLSWLVGGILFLIARATTHPVATQTVDPGVQSGVVGPVLEVRVPMRAWLADPSGRHELRYFDDGSWTDHVSDAGTISKDVL